MKNPGPNYPGIILKLNLICQLGMTAKKRKENTGKTNMATLVTLATPVW